MPTYVYACTECDHRFEAQQAFTDDALSDCPNCGGKLRKVFNSVGIVFKGSGFYRTDSRGNGKSTDSSSSSSSSSSDSAKSSGSTDSGSSSSSGDSSKSTATPAKTGSATSSTASSSSSTSSSSGSAA